MIERPDAGFEVVALVEEAEAQDLARTRPGDVKRGIPKLSEDASTDTLAHRQDGTSVDTRTLVVAPLAVASGREAASGRAPRLLEIAQAKSIDLIVVAIEDRRKNLPTEELLECRLGGIAVREQEALYEQITGRIAIEALRPSYLIFNEGFSRQPWNELGKRLLDVSVSLFVLLLTWPLMIATAIAVRLDSPGPIFFRQERVGRDNQPFTLTQVPQHARRRREPERPGLGHAATTRASRAWAASSAARASTSCRSSSRCSPARCRWSGRGPSARTSWPTSRRASPTSASATSSSRA